MNLYELTINQTRDMILQVGKEIIENKERLNSADRVIGDGDHGAAMARGFARVSQVLQGQSFDSIEELFIETGNALLASVGGCAGILFGTFFRSGGKAISQKKILDSKGLAVFTDAAFKAIQKRGGAQVGDKTMLDALYPAVQAASQASGSDLVQCLDQISMAAQQGMEDTKNLMAVTGRAKKYGEQTIGQPDPGAITTYLIFQGMKIFLQTL